MRFPQVLRASPLSGAARAARPLGLRFHFFGTRRGVCRVVLMSSSPTLVPPLEDLGPRASEPIQAGPPIPHACAPEIRETLFLGGRSRRLHPLVALERQLNGLALGTWSSTC